MASCLAELLLGQLRSGEGAGEGVTVRPLWFVFLLEWLPAANAAGKKSWAIPVICVHSSVCPR